MMGRLVVVMAICALAACGCGRSASPTAATGAGPMERPQASATGGAAAGQEELSGRVVNGVREIEVEAFRYGYKPDPIVVKKGEKVRITATSRDVTHGFGVEALNINVQVSPGKPQVIEFTPEEAGEYEIHCTVYCGPGHEEMHAKLVVRE